MPKLTEFNGVSQGWINMLAAVSAGAVKDAIEEGADFMRNAINNSPTGHPWHARKNDANDFPTGARIGNTNPEFGEVDPNSGLMLASVTALGPFKNGSSEILGFYGWVNTQKDYFIDQDTGNYLVGAAAGMGLLNGLSTGAGSVMRNYGAKFAAEEKLMGNLKAAGLRTSGSGDLF
jgi:hypothetical protein